MNLIPDLFGSPIAESDEKMLDNAFSEFEEFKLLTNPTHRYIVVGRRGTGKSALHYQLKKHWNAEKNTLLIRLEPDDASMKAIRSYCELLTQDYKQLRRIARMIWFRGLLSEIALEFQHSYKFKKLPQENLLRETAANWTALSKHNFFARLMALLDQSFKDLDLDPKKAFIQLEKKLNSNDLMEEIKTFCSKHSVRAVILADKLDEGWDEISSSTAFIAGFIIALDSIRLAVNTISAVAFIRDNIFRAVKQRDEEGSRILENCYVRLHWDEDRLFSMICNRIRYVYKSKETSNNKVWNLLVDQGLEGRKGFLQCLGHTLYRPRDIIELLNRACTNGAARKQPKLAVQNIEIAAQQVSETRKNELLQEYCGLFPALRLLIAAFNGSVGVLDQAGLVAKLTHITVESASDAELHDLALLGDVPNRAVMLYRVGFIGIKQKDGRFVFCHDGSLSDFEFKGEDDKFMIHPCYWTALGCIKQDDMSWENAVQLVHDEYEKKAAMEPYYRTKRITELLRQINTIKDGDGDADKFEEWCLEALKCITAGSISNLELHPNKKNAQRRDIVGTIIANQGFWKRIHEDHLVRQMIFEIKNYSTLSADDFAQVKSYMLDHYGKLVIIISKRENDNPTSNDVKHLKETWLDAKKMFVILSHSTVTKILKKLRSPDKFESATQHLEVLLDAYCRVHLHR